MFDGRDPAPRLFNLQGGLFCLRSVASACRQGAGPWLHSGEEEDGRPVWQHHRRTLQGTEGRCAARFYPIQLLIGEVARRLQNYRWWFVLFTSKMNPNWVQFIWVWTGKHKVVTSSEPGACSSSRVGLQHLLLLFIRLFSSLRQFRLKRCGLHKPIYLVEECGSAASHLSLPETTLQQAIVNTQVECTRGATWVTLKLKQMLWCPAGRSHQKMVRCATCVASLPY